MVQNPSRLLAQNLPCRMAQSMLRFLVLGQSLRMAQGQSPRMTQG